MPLCFCGPSTRDGDRTAHLSLFIMTWRTEELEIPKEVSCVPLENTGTQKSRSQAKKIGNLPYVLPRSFKDVPRSSLLKDNSFKICGLMVKYRRLIGLDSGAEVPRVPTWQHRLPVNRSVVRFVPGWTIV